MKLSPVKNTNTITTPNRRVQAFKGNLNQATFSKRDNQDSLKKIFDTTDTQSAGMQYFDKFVVANKKSDTAEKSNTAIDFENALKELKQKNYFDENWIKNNKSVFQKLYGIDIKDDSAPILLEMIKDDLNRNKTPLIVNLEQEYLKERLADLHSQIPEINNLDKTNTTALILSAARPKEKSGRSALANLFNLLSGHITKRQKYPLYVLSKSTQNRNKPSVIDLHNKTDAIILEMPQNLTGNFEESLENTINDAKLNVIKNAKKNTNLAIIVANDLSKYIGNNPERLKNLKIEMAALHNYNILNGVSVVVLDLEGFDNTTLPAKTLMKDIPFYQEEIQQITQQFIQPYLSSDNKTQNLQFGTLLIDGGTKTDIAVMLEALQNEYSLPLYTVKNTTNTNDFINQLTQIIDNNDKKPIVFVPDIYRYIAFNADNKNFLDNLIKEQKALFVFTSNCPQNLNSITDSKSCLKVKLDAPSKSRLINAIKHYTDEADNLINENINKGENLPLIDTNFNYNIIANDFLCFKKGSGFSDLKIIVENARNNYLQNPQKTFFQYLQEEIIPDNGDSL